MIVPICGYVNGDQSGADVLPTKAGGIRASPFKRYDWKGLWSVYKGFLHVRWRLERSLKEVDEKHRHAQRALPQGTSPYCIIPSRSRSNGDHKLETHLETHPSHRNPLHCSVRPKPRHEMPCGRPWLQCEATLRWLLEGVRLLIVLNPAILNAAGIW